MINFRHGRKRKTGFVIGRVHPAGISSVLSDQQQSMITLHIVKTPNPEKLVLLYHDIGKITGL